MRRAGRLLLLMPLVLLIACQPTTPTVQLPPLSAPSGLPLIVYERVNGESGSYERWEIYADGWVVHGDATEGYLDPEALMVLMEQVEQAGFFEMEDLYLPNDPDSGGTIYALSIRTEGGMKTVVATDGAPGEPPALVDLIRRMDGLVRREA